MSRRLCYSVKTSLQLRFSGSVRLWCIQGLLVLPSSGKIQRFSELHFLISHMTDSVSHGDESQLDNSDYQIDEFQCNLLRNDATDSHTSASLYNPSLPHPPTMQLLFLILIALILYLSQMSTWKIPQPPIFQLISEETISVSLFYFQIGADGKSEGLVGGSSQGGLTFLGLGALLTRARVKSQKGSCLISSSFVLSINLYRSLCLLLWSAFPINCC